MTAPTAVATLVLAALTAGCAAPREVNCRAVDWPTLGLSDGENGAPADRFALHMQTCRGQLTGEEVERVRAPYVEAREVGLRSYCRPENAYRVGRSGRRLVEVCPEESAAGFREAFLHGEQYYLLTERILDLLQKIREIRDYADEIDLDDYETNRLIFRVEEEIADLEERLKSYDTWPPRRPHSVFRSSGVGEPP